MIEKVKRKKVEIIEDSIKSKIPYRIKYKNYIYMIACSNPEKLKRNIWHRQNYRKIKDNPNKKEKFYSASIQGYRNTEERKDIIFYNKKNHSNIYLERNKKIHKKIRTNNSLENFNRIFGYSYHMEGHINLIKYIDILLEFAKDQIEFYKSQLNIQQKQHIKTELI